MTTENTERDELADIMMRGEIIKTAWLRRRPHALADADAMLAAGYSRPRQVSTPAEANSLPDRAAILTPGEIIFRKWADYYGEGKDAWERELGQVVPAELLDASSHFPATVLYSPVAD